MCVCFFKLNFVDWSVLRTLIMDEFSNQLPELASGSLDAEGFCKKLTDAAQKND